MRRLQPTSCLYLGSYIIVFLVGYIIFLMGKGNPFVVSVGTSLIAAGSCGIITFAYVLSTDDVRNRLKLISRAGLLEVFPARQVSIKQEYDERLAHVKRHIDILGFGLNALREDYAESFGTWASKATVRVLLLDPKFPTADNSLANIRDAEEGHSSGTISKEVSQFIEAAKRSIPSSANASFEVRLYRCIPTVNIFRVDDELFWGPYLVEKPSRNTATLLVQSGGELFAQLHDHFENIWKNAELADSLRD